MKALILVLFTMASVQAVAAGFGQYTPNKWASESTVADAKANPSRYIFDDGGNIDFGNSIYKRRISLGGQPQACVSGNYLYAGTAQKCTNWTEDDDDNDSKSCTSTKTVELMTQMTGTKQVCKDVDDDDDDNFGGSGKQKCWMITLNKGPQVKVALVQKAGKQFKGFVKMTLPTCNDM